MCRQRRLRFVSTAGDLFNFGPVAATAAATRLFTHIHQAADRTGFFQQTFSASGILGGKRQFVFTILQSGGNDEDQFRRFVSTEQVGGDLRDAVVGQTAQGDAHLLVVALHADIRSGDAESCGRGVMWPSFISLLQSSRQ